MKSYFLYSIGFTKGGLTGSQFLVAVAGKGGGDFFIGVPFLTLKINLKYLMAKEVYK